MSKTSFIEINKNNDFPLQNLPYGAFLAEGGETHLCTAIGDLVVDLFVLDEAGLFEGPLLKNQYAFQDSSLNFFMSLGKPAWQEARETLTNLLGTENPKLRDDEALCARAFVHQDEVVMMMPVQIGDYTDFYSSEQHAFNVGSMFRDPDNALMPNWKHLPVGYHGRASSIVLSGTDLHRPKGQTIPADSNQPVFGPSKLVDFELEVGFLTGTGNILGDTIDIEKAEDHIFGLVLVNDWSARDIQKWEYQPLGPFLAKNWATSISPWIVTLDALEPFRTSMPEQDPAVLPYLQLKERTTFDIKLDVFLKPEDVEIPQKISSSNFKNLYWSIAQQLAHQTVNGCNVQPGDLYASGTISGSTEGSYGSMLELTWRGSKPIRLENGEERKFINDNDTVIMKGYAEANGQRVGFGEVSGRIISSK